MSVPIAIFPEGEDPLILSAARRLCDQRIADPVLLGHRDAIESAADKAGISLENIRTKDPDSDENAGPYAQALAQGPRQMALKLTSRLIRKPLYFGAMMVAQGDGDAMIAGVANPTKRVIEAGLMAIGLADGVDIPSSFFLMNLHDFQTHGDTTVLFADCAVNVNPNADELASIAIASAHSAAKLLNETPRVAMLSFSTKGSGSHADADKVVEALKIAKARAPELLIDGEFQADSALIPTVAAKKTDGQSEVAGKANVLIFPTLDAGNIAYKLVQYTARADAIGPILQGFAKPVADLSRGASIDDIIATTKIVLSLS